VKDQFLDFDIRLLVLRHGRQRVLEALAKLGEQNINELEKELELLKRVPRTSQVNSSKELIDLVTLECRNRPDVEEPLRAIILRFENRTFLPTLRDVRNFLERLGVSTADLKSREAAGPILVRTLAKRTREDLLRLTATKTSTSESDYSLLAQAIMKSRTTKSKD
jgi:hypothetical protein